MGMIIKNGSIYQLTKIESNNTTIFSKHGKFIVKLITIRLLNISEDSKIVVSFNGHRSEYVLSDLVSIFTNETFYVPFVLYYNVSEFKPDGNEFIVGFKTDYYIDSLDIAVNIKESSNPMYSVESIFYEKLVEYQPEYRLLEVHDGNIITKSYKVKEV